MVQIRDETGHEVLLLQGSSEFFPTLIECMDAAVHHVWMETYIFDFMGAAQEVACALERAARRGVQVRLVVDGVGTGQPPAHWQSRFNEAGVKWGVFAPLGMLGLLIPSRWRRLHRKLCVIDEQWLFCGGINILDDDHNQQQQRLPAPRFDLAVRVRGPVVKQAMRAMQQVWWRMQAGQNVRERHIPDAFELLRHQVLDRWLRPDHQRSNKITTRFQSSQMDALTHEGVRVSFLLRDNVRFRSRIEKAYLYAIGSARHEVIIANAYFLPGRRLRHALIRAAQRGVRVVLLLQGRYEHFMTYYGTHPVYGQLLQAGVQIYEYEASFLHAKVAVVDEHWSTVGSSNLDPLSLLLAREANVVVHDAGFAQQLKKRLVHAMQCEGRPLETHSYEKRPWHVRTLGWVAFGLMRTALWLTGRRY